MAMNVVLVPQRQSPKGMSLTWGAMEGVGHHLIFVASRKHSPEELEAVEALGGTDDCIVVKTGAETVAVVDDLSPAGEARYYGVAMVFTDGAIRSARFRAVPDGAAPEATPLSKAKGGAAKPAALRPAAAAAAPAARPSSISGAPAAPAARPASISGAPAAPAARPVAAPAQAPAPRPAAAPAAEEDPLEARKRAQREARARMEAERAAASGGAPAEAEAPAHEAAPPAREAAREEAPAAPAEEDPMEARKRQQAAARAARDGGGGGDAPASAEPPPQPGTVPLEETFDARMSGGTQTWDGLRIHWERAGGPVAAYEVIVSDHQIFGDELPEALAGRADFTSAVAVAPSVTAVIDNITPREARGWYLVLTRAKDGSRAPHPFKIGDAAESGKPVAPFVNPNRTGELRAEVEDLLGQARENWDRWKGEQDRGSQREAKRLVGDALLIFPNYPGAKALADEIG